MKVAIIVSVYNPNLFFLKSQIDSLLNQTYKADIYIRDDGSSMKEHLPYLKTLSKNHSNVFLKIGENCGVFNSFMLSLKDLAESEKYDIIGFSDQDDIALTNKVQYAVEKLRGYDDIPVLYFSQMVYTDRDLNKKKCPYIDKNKLGLKNALVESVVNGNLIFLNLKAARLTTEQLPMNFKMHDWWVYLCVGTFGTIIFDDRVTLLYRQHGANIVGGDSSFMSNMHSRIKRFCNKTEDTYPIFRQAKEFYNIYKDKMDDDQLFLLENFLNSKINFKKRIRYAFSRNSFIRMKAFDEFLLRCLIVCKVY